MKKILIVEDTTENIEAAKEFFSTVSGFDFVYAKNRKEAEEQLDEAFAVITDRSMPYEDISEDPKIWNGYLIAINAYAKGKPTLILTEHGKLGYGIVNTSYPDLVKVKDAASSFIGKKMSLWESGAVSGHAFHISWTYEIPKTSQEAWKLAWEKLLRQM